LHLPSQLSLFAKPIEMPKIAMPPIPPVKPAEKVVQAPPAPALPAKVQMPKDHDARNSPTAPAQTVEVAAVKPGETQKPAVKVEVPEVVKTPAKPVIEPQVAKVD